MQDAVAACREITADASRRAEGAVGDEEYIYKLLDGQFADGVIVGLWGSVGCAHLKGLLFGLS